MDTRLSVPHFYFGAQSAHARECGLAVRAAGIVLDLRDPFRYRGQHSVAMRNRFVAGKLNGAADGAGRTDLFPHGIRVSVTEREKEDASMQKSLSRRNWMKGSAAL